MVFASVHQYVARSGAEGHVGVFDLDTLKQVGDIPKVSAHGATVDTKYGHGIAAAKPVVCPKIRAPSANRAMQVNAESTALRT